MERLRSTNPKITSSECCGGPSLGAEGFAHLRAGLPPQDVVEEISGLLLLLGSPVRLCVVIALRRQSGLCVCDLAELTGTSLAAVSAHLQKLKLAGVVRSERDGQMVRYTLLKVEEVDRLEPMLRCAPGVNH